MMEGSPALYCSRKVDFLIDTVIDFYVDAPLVIAMAPNTPSEPSGSWDSIHVFEAAERGRQAHYKLTSTIMLQLVTHKGENEAGEGKQQHAGSTGVEGSGKSKGKGEGWKKEGEVSLSGSMTRQVRYVLNFVRFRLMS